MYGLMVRFSNAAKACQADVLPMGTARAPTAKGKDAATCG